MLRFLLNALNQIYRCAAVLVLVPISTVVAIVLNTDIETVATAIKEYLDDFCNRFDRY